MFAIKTTFFLLCSITISLFQSTSLNAQSIKQPSVSESKNLKSSVIKTTWKTAQFDSEREIEIEEAPNVDVDVDPPEVDVKRVPAGTNIPRSYIGLGGNIGLGGDATTVGDGAFSVVGKNAFNSNFALHSALLFGGDNTSLLSLTYGIPIKYQSFEIAYPFLGGGLLVEDLFSDFDIGGLATAGVDVLLTNEITGTVRLNLGFADDDTDVGLLLGVGLNI